MGLMAMLILEMRIKIKEVLNLRKAVGAEQVSKVASKTAI